MRLALLILMITLLPLRGWAVSAMAVDQGVLTDCPHATAQAATTVNHNNHDDDGGHATHAACVCASCGLCHLSTAVLIQTLTPETTHLAAMPAQFVSRFASVTAPPGLRPPII